MNSQILNNKIFLIFISSLLMGVAQQPLGLGYLAWFSLIPFIHVLVSINNYKHLIIFSFMWGFLYSISTVFWLAFNIGISDVAAFISMILTVLILCTNTILISLVWFRINFKEKYDLLLLPIIWVSIEYVRSYGILGFPWIDIANTQTDFLYLIQNAEFVGIYGISFWVISINVLIYKSINSINYKKNLIFLLITITLPFVSGYYLFNRIQLSELNNKITIIQPNINLINKRDYSKRLENLKSLIQVSKKHIDDGSSLILWPESALPYNNVQEPKTLNYIINNLLIGTDVHLLTGNVIYDNDGHYNSSVLINKNGIQEIYNKQQLVPVAEYVPMSDWFPSLKNFNLGQANFSKGREDVLFEVNGEKFSSLICFESTFPEINRRHANKGADFFTYLVNDGWYTTPPEPQQHMKQSVFRAIENRKSVLRCANTGISAIINPKGEILESLSLNESGIITSFIKKSNKGTFYTKYGNVFAIIMLIIVCVSFLKTFIKNEKTI